MTTNAKMTPRDFFLNLGALITLYITVPTLLTLIFRIIDEAYPRIERVYYTVSSISFPVATLIVVFPLFILFSWLMFKSYKDVPEKREHFLKKWIIYITLFISGALIVGDLVTVLYYFLDGQLMTTGFILKVLAVLIVAGAVFGYYISDLLGRLTPQRNKIWMGVAVVLVLGSIIWGFSVIGSPRTQRLMKYDQMKQDDLQSIQAQIVNYWQQKSALPQSLDGLSNPLSGFMVPVDPQTQQPYEYIKVSDKGFQLCATFNRESRNNNADTETRALTSQIYPYNFADENWKHGEGQVCFTRTIDPELYPPFPTKAVR